MRPEPGDRSSQPVPIPEVAPGESLDRRDRRREAGSAGPGPPDGRGVVAERSLAAATEPATESAERTERLAEAYARHGSSVQGLAGGLCGLARGEDVTVEVFLDLWSTPGLLAGAPEHSSLREWLLARTHRTAVALVRAEASPARDLPHQPPSCDGQDRPGPAAGAELDAALGGLAPLARQAISLAHFGGYRCEAIGVQLGEPADAVKRYIRSGLAGLELALTARRP